PHEPDRHRDLPGLLLAHAGLEPHWQVQASPRSRRLPRSLRPPTRYGIIMIKKLLSTLMLSLTCAVAVAAGGGYPLEQAPYRLNDMASLQNGAKLFVNYCLNCHSANS